MREIYGIEHETCENCGEEYPTGMMEHCYDCVNGPFCPDCLNDHEEEEHRNRCAECKEPLELDPPCPICKVELCEDCFKEHVQKCRFQHELGKAQRLLTQFGFILIGRKQVFGGAFSVKSPKGAECEC